MDNSLRNAKNSLPLLEKLGWSENLFSLHIISETLIAVSFLSIPLSIVYFIRHRKHPFQFLPQLLATLMFFVGLCHVASIYNFWFPHYWISGGVKAICAGLSIFSAGMVWYLMPRFLQIPSIGEVQELNSKLREANENLEEKVKKRTDQLEVMNNELGEINSIISHDFKNSLNSIICFSEVVFVSRTLEEARNSAGEIKRISWRLNEVIDDLRALVRLGADKLEFSSVDLNQLMDELSTSYHIELSNHQGGFQVDRLPVICGVNSLLYELFSNLMNNSLKFRKEDCPLKIQAYATEDQSHHYIHFCDNGVGIQKGEEDQIFNMYSRGSASLCNTGKSGSGIGLGFCRKVVRLHGGDIYAKPTSESSEGAHFVISLPKEGVC